MASIVLLPLIKARARWRRSNGACAGRRDGASHRCAPGGLAREIAGAADHHEGKRWREPHRDHVGRDELAEPDAGIEPAGREIDQVVARSDFQFDFGISLARTRRSPAPGSAGRPRGERTGATGPVGRKPGSRAAALAATSSSKAGFARDRKRSPASVRPTLRVVRMKSAAPTRASSARTAWLIAEGVTPSSAAARRKLRCAATLRNASTPSSAPCRTVKFCFMAHRHYRG